MPLFKKGNSGNLSKKTYENTAEKSVESVKKNNGDKTPPRPPKGTNITNQTSRQEKTKHSESSKSQGKEPSDNGANKTPPKFIFYCQLAHGSPTSEIQGFTNVKELYSKISESHKIDRSEILFCTLNTFKVDMDKLLGGQIALDDFIFAHVKGPHSEVKLVKTADALGLTITDNGDGLAFIKRIKEGSITDMDPGIQLGDHIASINGENVVGTRHYDVARKLRDIPKDEEIIFGLVKPQKAFQGINFGKSGKKGGSLNEDKIGKGKTTLRLRSTGAATLEDELPVWEVNAAKKVDDLLESFIGIRDSELADTLVELAKDKSNPSDFTAAVEQKFAEFEFPDDFVFDIWGIIDDAKHGRL